MEVLSKSSRQTKKIAKNFSKSLKPGDVVALRGDLGVGKTTFVQGLAEGLQIIEKITSPTFVFMRSYPIRTDGRQIQLHHIDLYRGQAGSDYKALGLEEIINGNDIAVLEWAGKIEEGLPKRRIDIKISRIDERTRRINIERN